MPTWADRLPFLSAAGKAQAEKRLFACAPLVAKTVGVEVDDILNAKRLGAGNYGITFLVKKLPSEKNVLKVTADNLEAHTVNGFMNYPGDPTPPGIVHYEGIWRLGKCGILPRMQPFKLMKKDVDYYGVPRHMREGTYWKGEGAPYRPLWVIQREELPDVMPELKKRGIKQGKLKEALRELHHTMHGHAVDAGIIKGISRHIFSSIDSDRLDELLAEVQGAALREACEWLIERQIAFFDFQKIINLGWREGTGLVIRDIGFASNTNEYDPTITLDGLGTFRRFVRDY